MKSFDRDTQPTIRHQGLGWFDNSPSCLFEHVNLNTGSVRVGENEAWPDDVEGGIDMHRVRIFELQSVNPEASWLEVSPHPVNSLHVGHLE